MWVPNGPDEDGSSEVRRPDVSVVPPQGGYIARRCAMRAQNDVLRPATPVPIAPEVQRRFDQGNTFEQSAVTTLDGLGIVARVVDGGSEELPADPPEGVTVLLGARLPTDVAGRRVGRPDMLVVAPGGGYRAVDIKHHMVLDAIPADGAAPAAIVSSLERPALEDATSEERFSARRRENDLLQLAHYQRMLEAAGLAAADGRWGGILGTERRIVWFNLDAPMWRGDSPGGQAMQSSMERYDSEFALRLDIIATAMAHQDDPTVELLAAPVRIGECAECPWWDYCRSRLQSGAGDISLLPRLGWREWKVHREHGVRDRLQLAQLDPLTARLVSSGIDIPELQRLVDGLDDDTPIAELGVVVRAKTQLARLQAEGVETFGDLMSLDPLTASYAGSAMTWLPGQIDLARAALGPHPIYRRRGLAGLVVDRADVEVDVDMENIEEGVYLWGALHSVREHGGTTSTYHAFVTWDPLTPEAEVTNFNAFWQWLTDVRHAAHRMGRSFRAYCYNASAENTYLRKLGLGLGAMDEVMAFIQSEEWVDLLRTVDDQLVTGTGSGLKAIAPLAGFHWGVDDPGGGISMVQYDIAAASENSPERERARQWLLTYNRGDVEATLAIRDWLEAVGSELPSITSVDPSTLAGMAYAAGRS